MSIWIGSKTYGSNSWTMAVLERTDTRRGSGQTGNIRKEAIQREIEEQLETGGNGLLEEDQLMMEVNLGDLENTSREQEHYWLVAIKAAWEAGVCASEEAKDNGATGRLAIDRH
jgi:hypothetical protein